MARRRRLTADELATWRAFLRAHATLVRGLERDLEQAGGVPLPFYGVLVSLAEAPEHALRLTDLAERVALTKSGLTRLLDRMEERGLVARRACEEDRRGQYAVLAPPGRRALRRSAPTHLRGIAARFADRLAPRELTVLREALGRVAEVNL